MKCSICESNNVKENVYSLPFKIKGGSIETQVSVCGNCGVHFRNVNFESEKIKTHYDVVGYVLPSSEDHYRKQR